MFRYPFSAHQESELCGYGFMTLTTAVVLCTRFQGLLLSVRRVHVVFSNAGLEEGGNPCHKAHAITALRRGIQQASRS